jgi:alkylation response protein AidB-like acyl-CoA dehydrogenase
MELSKAGALLPVQYRHERGHRFCVTEPNVGSDAGAVKAIAVKDGNSYMINGTKRLITSAPEAGLHIVYARRGHVGRYGHLPQWQIGLCKMSIA